MEVYNSHQQQLSDILDEDSSKTDWTDWKWHIRNSIKTVSGFEKALGIKFSDKERRLHEQTLKKFPLAVTPYYLSLIHTDNYKNDPVFKQSFPNPRELIISRSDMVDPLHEDKDSPVPGLTHRYPDRVLFHVSNLCSMYCRHCTRKRKVGDVDSIPGEAQLEAGLDYIRNTPQIRDVLLSGGDPFMLSDEKLDWLLTKIGEIDHVEVVRIGTRMPVVLPYRITDKLVNMLKKHHPLWINTHFNHPRELTASSRRALTKLADAGIPLGNQSVLLAGINDCPRLIKTLNHKLVKNRVRPYYLYQCDLSEGLSHFRTPVGKGIEIMESLRGHTSGFAVPTYVIDAPGGGGKIPVMPNYIVSWATNKIILRNYEGVITTYAEPETYECNYCDRDCENCKLQLMEDDAEENPIGIAKLLSDWDETLSLTPEENERTERCANDS
ncbi:lysine 2,3-aminomutase [Maridesulfovibrio ferrireducens]|uniref:lysine 2,3-aminomutase n=1 Tax=Maridesulfovibrio ferrireducens TaxID=246191 RepID=UPI001A18E682|nr:lysine 2,3-aminomutase [Maridesulfovibrio ferrireducens]MBI9109594.1 lysine 2,3-aminomutase [Maridesulfovibrio ferrireducens]